MEQRVQQPIEQPGSIHDGRCADNSILGLRLQRFVGPTEYGIIQKNE